MQPTPEQIKKLRRLAKVLDEGDIALLENVNELDDKIEALAKQIPPIDEVIARVKDGYSPKKGVDYFDGKDGYTPVKGKDYFDGNDGRTPIFISKAEPKGAQIGDIWYQP